MAGFAQQPTRRGTRRSRPRRAGHNPLLAPLVLFIAATIVSAGYVGYVLWPRWPEAPVANNAPPIPIVVAGVTFNIQPAAIRRDVQRHPGEQTRVDLVYLWPSLTPPDPAAKPAVHTPVNPERRLFVSIESGDDTLPLMQRVQAVYPHFLVAQPTAGPPGLTLRGFRDGTPYQGEELVFEFGSAHAFPGALHAPRRDECRQLPVGAAHRRSRHYVPLSARLAERLAADRQGYRHAHGAVAAALIAPPLVPAQSRTQCCLALSG